MLHHNALLSSLLVLTLAALAGPVAQNRSPSDAQSPAKPGDAPARTVLITGANRGIGLEFAKQYQAAGWNVIATAREPDTANDLKALGPGIRIVQLDVTSSDSVAALVKSLDKQPIDLLINNAGVTGNGRKLSDVKIDDLEHTIQVNAIGPIRITQALLPNLRTGKGKTVVSISSGLGSISENKGGGFYGYRESKAALDMFMRSLAAELKGDGFICIAMNPGWVKTDMGGPNAQLTPEQSISGMRKVLDGLKPEDTGQFWSHDGTKMPW